MAVFEDGFDSGDFSAWTGTGGPPAIDADPHCGTYSMQMDAANEYAYKSLGSNYAILYARCYVKLTSDLASGDTCPILSFYDTTGGGWQMRTGFYNQAGTKKVYISDDPGWTTANFAWSTGTWYCYDIKWDTTNDNFGVWVNDTRYIDKDVAIAGTTDTLYAGAFGTIYTNGDYNIDCCVVDTSYVGPEAAGGLSIPVAMHHYGTINRVIRG